MAIVTIPLWIEVRDRYLHKLLENADNLEKIGGNTAIVGEDAN